MLLLDNITFNYSNSSNFSIFTMCCLIVEKANNVRNINFFTVLINFLISVVGTFYFGIGGVILGSLAQAILGAIACNYLFFQKHQVRFSQIYSPSMFLNLTFNDFHMGRQKVPKSDFKVNF